MYIEALIAHTHKALAICPNNAEIYVRLGNLYTAARQFEKASYHYTEAIKLESAPSPAYYRLKFSLQATTWLSGSSDAELLESGVQVLRKAVQKNPNFPFANVVLGELLAQQGKHEEAISCFTNASYRQTRASHPELVKEFWSDRYQKQPDFLIAGFPKCGTTSLHSYLASHPKILPGITKEIRYRTLAEGYSLDSYLAHFPRVIDTSYLTFEATPSSALFPGFFREVSTTFPKIKLIIIMRNPIDRSISDFHYQQRFLRYRSSQPLETAIKSLLDSPDIVSDALSKLEKCLTDGASKNNLLEFYCKKFGPKILEETEISALSSIFSSCYVFYLKTWLHYFPREQLLILKSEDLFQKPQKTMELIYEFLDLPVHALPEYRHFNANYYPPISTACRHQLASWFRPYNQQLESYLDRILDW